MGWVKRGRRTTKARIGVHGLTGIKALLLSYSIISYHILRRWAVGIKNALQPRVNQTQQSCNAGGVPKDARCSRSILPNKTYPFCLKVTCKDVDAALDTLDMRNAQWGFTNSWNLVKVSGSAGRTISAPSLYKPSAYTPNYTIWLPNNCLNCYRAPWSVWLYVIQTTESRCKQPPFQFFWHLLHLVAEAQKQSWLGLSKNEVLANLSARILLMWIQQFNVHYIFIELQWSAKIAKHRALKKEEIQILQHTIERTAIWAISINFP